jgi:RNA polymerase-binding transcription factor DksA
MASRDTNNLNEIDEALRRLIERPEEFGKDEVTGEDIPFARLEIIPWARRGAAAARREEGQGEARA